jgi:hypothetical protein
MALGAPDQSPSVENPSLFLSPLSECNQLHAFPCGYRKTILNCAMSLKKKKKAGKLVKMNEL